MRGNREGETEGEGGGERIREIEKGENKIILPFYPAAKY